MLYDDTLTTKKSVMVVAVNTPFLVVIGSEKAPIGNITSPKKHLSDVKDGLSLLGEFPFSKRNSRIGCLPNYRYLVKPSWLVVDHCKVTSRVSLWGPPILSCIMPSWCGSFY